MFKVTAILLVSLFWLAASFSGGYLVGQADAFAGRHEVATQAARLARMVGLQSAFLPSTPSTTLTTDQQERFKIFWEAWSLVERDYYHRSTIDSQKMTYGAIKGMVESLGDPNTFFSNPREREVQETSIRGSFDGIGIQIDQRDNRIRVVAPIEGSPAERAGLRAGDIILKIDDKDLRGLPLNEVVPLIRGPRGTTVTLIVGREGQPNPLTIPVTRAEIKVESVRSKMLDNGLGYLRITSFAQNTATDASAAIKRLQEQQARGIILDVRSNPGGFLHSAIDVTSQFLSEGVVLYQQQADGERKEYRTRQGVKAISLPVVVLQDKGSASASEIVAAALRDNGRATIVGEKSYGKGTVQTVHSLSDRSGLRVTTASWLTPRGEELDKKGLLPDIAVAALSPETATDRDVQLEAAVQQLNTQLGAVEERPAS